MEREVKAPTALGMLGFVASNMGKATPAFRRDIFNDKFDGIEVDTVCVPDTGLWETGVKRNGDAWVIVDQYPKGKAEAELGHVVWCEKLRAEPAMELADIFVGKIEMF